MKGDAFGLINEGDKTGYGPYTEQGSHDLNSVRTSLHSLDMKSTYTPEQYQKILKLLNEEKKSEDMVNIAGISNDFNILLVSDKRKRL